MPRALPRLVRVTLNRARANVASAMPVIGIPGRARSARLRAVALCFEPGEHDIHERLAVAASMWRDHVRVDRLDRLRVQVALFPGAEDLADYTPTHPSVRAEPALSMVVGRGR